MVICPYCRLNENGIICHITVFLVSYDFYLRYIHDTSVLGKHYSLQFSLHSKQWFSRKRKQESEKLPSSPSKEILDQHNFLISPSSPSSDAKWRYYWLYSFSGLFTRSNQIAWERHCSEHHSIVMIQGIKKYSSYFPLLINLMSPI